MPRSVCPPPRWRPACLPPRRSRASSSTRLPRPFKAFLVKHGAPQAQAEDALKAVAVALEKGAVTIQGGKIAQVGGLGAMPGVDAITATLSSGSCPMVTVKVGSKGPKVSDPYWKQADGTWRIPFKR